MHDVSPRNSTNNTLNWYKSQ